MRSGSLRIVPFVSLLSVAMWQCHDHDARRGGTDDAQVVGGGDLETPSPDFSLDSGNTDDRSEEGPRRDPPRTDLQTEDVREEGPHADPLLPDLPPPLDISDATEPEGCVRSWEECLVPIPGCWTPESPPYPELTDCSIAGCGPDVPGIDHLIHGGDYCDNAWVVLGDASGRIEARDLVRETLYGEYSFTTYLDGDPVSYCNVHGLPTGAIRYQMMCDDPSGETIYAAVLETGPCPDCRDVQGCYEVENDDIICLVVGCADPIDKVEIRARGGDGCRVYLRADTASIQTLSGWVSYDGVLTLGYDRYGSEPLNCTFENDGDGFGPALCRFGRGDGAETFELDIFLTPIDDEPCDLPECVLDESCVRSNLGERCVDGECQ